MSSPSDSYSPNTATDHGPSTPQYAHEDVEQAHMMQKQPVLKAHRTEEGGRFESPEAGEVFEPMATKGFLDPRSAEQVGHQDGRQFGFVKSHDHLGEQQYERVGRRDERQFDSISAQEFTNVRQAGQSASHNAGSFDAMPPQHFTDPRQAGQFVPRTSEQHSSIPSPQFSDPRQSHHVVDHDDRDLNAMPPHDFANTGQAGQFMRRGYEQENFMPSHHVLSPRQTQHSISHYDEDLNSLPPQHFTNLQQASQCATPTHQQSSSSNHARQSRGAPPSPDYLTPMHKLARELNTKASRLLQEILDTEHNPLSDLHIRIIIWLLDPTFKRSNAHNFHEAYFNIDDIDDCFSFILEQFYWGLGKQFLVELCREGLKWKDKGFEAKESVPRGIRWNDIERMERQVGKMKKESDRFAKKVEERKAGFAKANTTEGWRRKADYEDFMKNNVKRKEKLRVVEKGRETVDDRREWFQFDKEVVEKLKEWESTLEKEE